jgi:hypothetical protein
MSASRALSHTATIEPSALWLFTLFLLPRLMFSTVLSSVGYVGSGGDPEAYHVLGLYAKDLWLNPALASLETVLEDWWMDEEESIEEKYTPALTSVEAGDTGLFVSTTAPIIGLHALVYAVWPKPIAFVFATSLLASLAYALFVRRLGITRQDAWLYALNPVSIYFAATHYKESICETLIVCLLALLSSRPRYFKALILSVILCAFRIDFLPFVPFLWLNRTIARFDARLVLAGAMLAFTVLPSFYWSVGSESAGPLYSLVRANVFTERFFGPLVGLIMPLPFMERVDNPFGALMTVYALFYWALLPTVLTYVLLFRRPEPWATTAILICLCISYYVIGGAGGKTRFFAPFLPLLILAFTQVRRPVTQWLAGRLRAHAAKAEVTA